MQPKNGIDNNDYYIGVDQIAFENKYFLSVSGACSIKRFIYSEVHVGDFFAWYWLRVTRS